MQFQHGVIASAFVAGLVISFSPVQNFWEPVGTDIGNPAIKGSAFGPVFFWCLGAPIAFVERPWVYGARFAWTLGGVLSLLHIAVAFHLGHGWSHRAAWEHTRQVGGYGDGIFVNDAFVLVWLADVLWAWVALDSYLARSRWLKWSVFGFLAFVVFNAAVVFGGWGSRVAFGVGVLGATAVAVNAFRGRHLRGT